VSRAEAPTNLQKIIMIRKEFEKNGKRETKA
jgi:hypothetical protein